MTNIKNSTAELQQLDRQHHMHPFTDGKELNETGVRIITRGEGVYLWDSEGKKLLDGMGGLWCVAVGYGRQELAEAATRQMQELSYYNTFFKTTTAPATELAAVLAEISPEGFNHTFFGNSGSESNDTVIRMVRHYWALEGKPSRSIIISRVNAYHGSTMGAASLGGMDYMHAQGGMPIPGIEHIEQPFWYQEGGDLSPDEFGLKAAGALEDKILEVGAENVAAFIGEPVQGAGAVIVPPATYWPEIQRICDKYDILLVADEVICGFGRTGNWFGTETFGLKPHIMTIAKGLSSGYMPISGVMVHDRVANLIQKSGEFNHGYTYSGHPVAAAVALANIELIKRDKIVETVRDVTGPYLTKKLKELESHPLVGEVRCSGLMAAIQLTKNKETRELFKPVGEIGTVCRDYCVDDGLIVRATADSMLMSPPLSITVEEIDEMMGIMKSSLDKTAKDYKIT